MKARSTFGFTLALAGALGCTTATIPGPLVVSTRPVPELGNAATPEGKRVSGESCARIALLFIPVGVGTVEAAYEDALEKAPGTDTLVGYEERMNLLFLFPFFYQVCTEVHGYAVSSKGAPAQAATKPEAPNAQASELAAQ